MSRSFTFWRLFLGNLIVTVIVVSLVGVLAYWRLDENYQRRARQEQIGLANALAGQFQGLWPLDGPRIDRMCKSFLREGSAPGAPPESLSSRLTVVDPNGTVLGETLGDPAAMVNHRTPDRPEILAALEGRTGEIVRYSETEGMEFRYVAIPVTYGGQTVAAVRLAVPVRTIAEGSAAFRDALIASALGAILVAALLGLLANWVWAGPLRRASLVARQIAAGDFSKSLRVAEAGELADLARAMNEMRDSLVGQIRQTRAQQQNLQTVLASLREAILAIRADGTIALLNQAAADLLSVKPADAVGKRLEAVVPSLDIINLYRDAGPYAPAGPYAQAVRGGAPAGAAGRPPVSGQVLMDKDGAGRILEVQAAQAASEVSDIGGILVLRDVTELANAAAMKSQFVANASHELRTPLATIRAAVDALLDVDPADPDARQRCLDILNRHLGRLEALTRDLLDLHMVESGKLALSLRDLRLGDLAQRVQAEFGPRPGEKGLQFSVAARPGECEIRSDRALVELILRNLVDNAIKFTPAGGSVECTLESAAGPTPALAQASQPAGSPQAPAAPAPPAPSGAVLRVRDTGVGISRQDQTRVFERFFQVDSARTGDARLRGTGLGLAIVKHAAERLGAKVELQSALGKGTTITVTLPAAASE